MRRRRRELRPGIGCSGRKWLRRKPGWRLRTLGGEVPTGLETTSRGQEALLGHPLIEIETMGEEEIAWRKKIVGEIEGTTGETTEMIEILGERGTTEMIEIEETTGMTETEETTEMIEETEDEEFVV